MAQTLELYAVVCTEFHRAIGPFPKQVAEDAARELTKTGPCTYLPVPLEFRGVIMDEAAAQRAQAGGDADMADYRPPGQYL